MKTERPPEQAAPSDEAANTEEAEVQPTARRVAYKTVLFAVVIGMITISVLWLFMIRQADSLATEAPVMTPDLPAPVVSVANAVPAAKTDPELESIGHKLAALSGQIDRGFEAQQSHSSDVKHELSAMVESLQTIKGAMTALGDSNKALGRRISEASAQLQTLAKEVRALKAVKRKSTVKRKPRPVKIPPFQIDAIDIWDDVTYVAVSQAGRVAFLKPGEQQSGWTVTHIDRLKGQVDFQGPAGQAHTVSLQR